MKINKGFYPFAVIYSFWFVLLSLAYFPTKLRYANYFKNVAYYLDILGNALAGGNPEVTVSARVGYNAFNRFDSKYWKTCESLIDWAFRPVDGYNHCYKAYIWTVKRVPEINIHEGYDIVLAIALPFIILVCFILRPLIWTISKI